MIIRMTVNDNDFRDVLESFCKSLFIDLWTGNGYTISSKGYSIEQEIERFHHTLDVQALLNPNNDHNLTKEEKELLCDDIKVLWNNFVIEHLKQIHTYFDEDAILSASDYLIRSFRVDIWFRFFDKFENGEVVYYFTTNQKFITQ